MRLGLNKTPHTSNLLTSSSGGQKSKMCYFHWHPNVSRIVNFWKLERRVNHLTIQQREEWTPNYTAEGKMNPLTIQQPWASALCSLAPSSSFQTSHTVSSRIYPTVLFSFSHGPDDPGPPPLSTSVCFIQGIRMWSTDCQVLDFCGALVF